MQRCVRCWALEGQECNAVRVSWPWRALNAARWANLAPGGPRVRSCARLLALGRPECNTLHGSVPWKNRNAVLCAIPGLGGAKACREPKNCEILSGALVRKPPKIRVRPGHPGMHYCAHCWSLEGPERSNVAFLVPGGAQNAALWANLAPGGPRMRHYALTRALEGSECSSALGSGPWKSLENGPVCVSEWTGRG